MKFNLNNPAFLQMAGQARKASDYFYIRSLADGNEITFANTKLGAFADNLEYSLDGNSWNQLTEDESITLDNGDTIFFRNPNEIVYSLAMETNVVKTSAYYEVGGNIIQLFYPGVELPSLAFRGAFLMDRFILSASNIKLPATTLAESCYREMFYECQNLTAAPELPATTLAESCYREMFFGCSNLTAAPELPATTLAASCYEYMFGGCARLTAAPELPATTLAESCYKEMFSTCSGLTIAPKLPATTLAESCYRDMFNGCSNLTAITCLAKDISANSSTENWVTNVLSSGIFTKAGDMEDWPEGADGIPTGWTVQNYVG